MSKRRKWKGFNVIFEEFSMWKSHIKKLFISNCKVPDILPNSMEQSIVAHVLGKWFTDPSTCYILYKMYLWLISGVYLVKNVMHTFLLATVIMH